jgi:hypothetical protein
MRLVWSQPSSAHDRRRHPLLVSLVLIFLGGTLVGSGGDLSTAPKPLRAAVASLLAAGGVLFLGGAVLAVRGTRRRKASLSLAEPIDPTKDFEGRPYRQEEQ